MEPVRESALFIIDWSTMGTAGKRINGILAEIRVFVKDHLVHRNPMKPKTPNRPNRGACSEISAWKTLDMAGIGSLLTIPSGHQAFEKSSHSSSSAW